MENTEQTRTDLSFSFDFNKQAPVMCRVFQKKNIFAAILLSGFSSIVPPGAAYASQEARTIEMIYAQLSNVISQIAESDQNSDMNYVGTGITESLKITNRQLWDVSRLTGQGLYASGVIFYAVNERYLLFPFGGAAAYSVAANRLIRQGTLDSNDNLIYDALGGNISWQGQCWNGNFPKGSKMLLLSEPIFDLQAASAKIQAEDGGQAETTAMRIRQSQTRCPDAIIEISND